MKRRAYTRRLEEHLQTIGSNCDDATIPHRQCGLPLPSTVPSLVLNSTKSSSSFPFLLVIIQNMMTAEYTWDNDVCIYSLQFRKLSPGASLIAASWRNDQTASTVLHMLATTIPTRKAWASFVIDVQLLRKLTDPSRLPLLRLLPSSKIMRHPVKKKFAIELMTTLF